MTEPIKLVIGMVSGAVILTKSTVSNGQTDGQTDRTTTELHHYQQTTYSAICAMLPSNNTTTTCKLIMHT